MKRAFARKNGRRVIALAIVGAALAVPTSAAAAVSAAVDGNKLLVTGGDAAETATLGYLEWESDPYYSVDNGDVGQNVTPGVGCHNPPEFQTPDVLCSPNGVASVGVTMGLGGDQVQASGCGGLQLPDPVWISGGGGGDSLEAHTAGPRVTLLGGGGSDGFDSFCGINPLTAKGGPKTDYLHGSCGPGDKLFGEGGGDWLYAKDGAQDLVDGGPGSDGARTDGSDIRRSLEMNWPNPDLC